MLAAQLWLISSSFTGLSCTGYNLTRQVVAEAVDQRMGRCKAPDTSRHDDNSVLPLLFTWEQQAASFTSCVQIRYLIGRGSLLANGSSC